LKRAIFFLLIFSILYIFPKASLAGVRVGEEVRIRWVPVSNGDHGYLYQRTRFLIEGVLAKAVTVGLRIQSRGFWGIDTSTVTIEGLTRENMIPWIENAYVKVDEFFKLPVYLVLGRQPVEYGNGLLANDNASGYDACRLSAFLPGKIDCELILLKPTEASGASPIDWKEKNAYGLFFKRRWKIVIPQLCGFWERDKATEIEKNFIGITLSGNPQKGIDYQGGLLTQSGKGGGRDYKGLAYFLGGRFKADTKLGTGILVCEYLVGSGEVAPVGKDENFLPGYGHLKEEDYGEYYMENRNEIRTTDPDYSITNLKIFKLGISLLPISQLQTGLNYFIYNSYNPKGNIGDEINLFARYEYSENLSFRLSYGAFMAGKITQESGDKVLGEVMVRF